MDGNNSMKVCTGGSSSAGGGGGMTVSMSGSSSNSSGPYDTVWECVIPYVTDTSDRQVVSLVCKRWYEIDGLTRKHMTIPFCYSATPEMLLRRFPQIESLKIKGKPRTAMFNIIPEDWGGYVTPWVNKIIISFLRIKELHFRRMIVSNHDIELLADSSVGRALEVLKLDKCTGFTTDGLVSIGRFCRNLRTFIVEETLIMDSDGEWLHQLALNNNVLENLSFYTTYLSNFSPKDIELIARNCPRLTSLKIFECDLLNLIRTFDAVCCLEEFSGGSFDPYANADKYASVVLPPRVCRLALPFWGKAEMPIINVMAFRLKKLDLVYALLDTEDHCRIIEKCLDLEILQVRDVIGDRGLEVVGRICKKMRRLRIEPAEHVQQHADSVVTQRGLIALAIGCLELEYLSVYVSDITNEALECIGTCSKKLHDFRLVLLNRNKYITDLPLDNGVRSLLSGCERLTRFALYLREGGLTDMGMSYIGQYGLRIRWLMLGCVGESDTGLIEFSRGCPSLRKLEMRECIFFNPAAVATAVVNLTRLRCLWIQGCNSILDYQEHLSGMMRPFWYIELITARKEVVQNAQGRLFVIEEPSQLLAYYSLAGPRTDYPVRVKLLKHDADITT